MGTYAKVPALRCRFRSIQDCPKDFGRPSVLGCACSKPTAWADGRAWSLLLAPPAQSGREPVLDMRPRAFIPLFGVAVATLPLAARALPPERVPRIGVLLSSPADASGE